MPLPVAEMRIRNPSFFVNDIFDNLLHEHHEGDHHEDDKDTFDEQAIELLLEKLKTGGEGGHDGHDHHDHEHDGENDHAHKWRRSVNGEDHKLHHGPTYDRDLDTDHSNEHNLNHHHGHDHNYDHDHDHDHDHEEDNLPGCFSAKRILKIFSLPEKNIKRDEFHKICPAIIQQSLSTACATNSSASTKAPLSQIYGYGFLATLIITLASLVGVTLVPCLNSAIYERLMTSFVCLGIGTMLGDAFLHIIPLSLGLHNHEHGHEHGSAAHDTHAHAYLWKMLLLLIAIYIFYLVESIFALVSRTMNGIAPDENDNSHGHSHIKPPANQTAVFRKKASSDAEENRVEIQGKTNLGYEKDVDDEEMVEKKETPDQVLKPKTGICGIPTVAALVVIGDGIHNFVDGVAIAAAFTTSLRAGLSTSIAVLLHELPHEFGDFAIFIGSGIGYGKALALNLLSALTAFLGLFLGVQIATDETILFWILAITGGMFIYVSLVNMLPEVMHSGESRTLVGFLAQNAGIWAGVGLMLLIALYEDKIQA